MYGLDLGLLRFRTALSATATTFAVTLLLFWLAALLGQGGSFVVPGVLVVAVATMAVGMDRIVGHRTVTMLLMPVPAAAAVWLAAHVSGQPVLTALVFMAMVVATIAGSIFGSRGILLCLTAVAVFYGADLADVPIDTVSTHVLAVVVAALVSAVMLGVVLRERPDKDQARIMRSLRVLSTGVARAAQAGDRTAARRSLDRFSAAVSTTRAHIESHPQNWPPQMARDAGAGLGSFELRLERAASDVLEGGDSTSLAALLDDSLLHTVSPRRRMPKANADAAGFHSTVDDDAAMVPPLPPSVGGRSQVSMAAQLLVAAAASITVSMLIDPDRWFWGVLAALVMLFGTSSAADAIGKGARRVIGTAAALPVGALIVALTQDTTWVVIGCLLVAMFAQQYLADVAYGLSIFFLTVFLYLIFALSSGQAADAALGTRLWLTTVGAAIGILVALLVVPTRSGTLLRGRAGDVLGAAETLMDCVMGARPEHEVQQAAHATHQRYLLLKAEADASRRGWPLSRSHAVIAAQLDAAAVVIHELRRLAEEFTEGERLTSADLMAARDVRRSLAAIHLRLDAEAATPSPGDAEATGIEVGRPSLTNSPAPAIGETLERLGRAADGLSRALAIG